MYIYERCLIQDNNVITIYVLTCRLIFSHISFGLYCISNIRIHIPHGNPEDNTVPPYIKTMSKWSIGLTSSALLPGRSLSESDSGRPNVSTLDEEFSELIHAEAQNRELTGNPPLVLTWAARSVHISWFCPSSLFLSVPNFLKNSLSLSFSAQTA